LLSPVKRFSYTS